MSTESRLSQDSAVLARAASPTPPPSVSPPMPVVETTPPGVASPKSCVSRSTSPQVAPPWRGRCRATGSTRTPRIGERSITRPPSHDGVAGHVVAAAAHRQQQAVLAGEVDRGDDVGGARAAGDQRRAAVDQPLLTRRAAS